MRILSNSPQFTYIALVTMIAGIAGLLLGYDAGIIGVSKDQITVLFSLSDNQWSVIAGASILGALISLPICGKLSNFAGRKNMLIIVAIGFLGGILLTASSHGINQFVLGRFLTGMSIGMGSFTTPLFISEIAPTKNRGTLLLINSIAITVGQSLSVLVGYFIHDTSIESWRYLILLGMFPAIFLLFGMVIAPHSPRWVAMKYGIESARVILQKLRGDIILVENELIEINETLSRKNTSLSFFKLFIKPLRNITCIGIVLGVFQQFVGIGTILYFGPVIFLKAGFHSVSDAILATFFMGVINLISTIGVMFLVDRFGRRPLLLSGTLIAGISLIFVGIANYTHTLNHWFTFLFIGTYIVGYCISLGSLFWVIIAEIYPLQVRGLAMSVAATAETTASLIIALTFLQLIKYMDLSGTFWIYSGMCFLAFIFIYFYVPETKSVSLEQIEKNVNDGLHSRHLGRANIKITKY